MYHIVYTKQAAKDIHQLKSAGLVMKAKALIDIMRNDPFQNPPPYEGLVGNLDGFYSRRINIKHRLVYQVDGERIELDGKSFEGTIKVVRMWTHYEGI